MKVVGKEMMSPCHDYCYVRFGKSYTKRCDTSCEYARVVKENRDLKKKLLEYEVAEVNRDLRDNACRCEPSKLLENAEILKVLTKNVAYRAKVTVRRL